MNIDPAEIYADESERLKEIFLKTFYTLQKSFRGYMGVIPLRNLFGGCMIVSPGIEHGDIVFHSQNNNIVLYLIGKLQTMWELEIFSSAPGRL
jgi:hypothetical protein